MRNIIYIMVITGETLILTNTKRSGALESRHSSNTFFFNIPSLTNYPFSIVLMLKLLPIKKKNRVEQENPCLS